MNTICYYTALLRKKGVYAKNQKTSFFIQTFLGFIDESFMFLSKLPYLA